MVAALLVIFTLCFGGRPACAAQRRVALLIGNATYRDDGWVNLSGVSEDVDAMEGKLKQLGFSVIMIKKNAGSSDMKRAISDFAEVIGRNDLALVFYAGHGYAVESRNYLIPTDMGSDYVNWTAQDWDHNAVSVSDLINQIKPRGSESIFFLNNCRAAQQSLAGLSTTLSYTDHRTTKSEQRWPGIFAVFATEDRQFAIPAENENGLTPFGASLLEQLSRGLSVQELASKLQQDVRARTKGRQRPTVFDSTGRNKPRLGEAVDGVTPGGQRPRHFAIVVGNSDYADVAWGNLHGPAVDARQLAAKLMHIGFEPMKPLVNGTREKILATVEQTAQNLTKNDTVLLYYSGHAYVRDFRNQYDQLAHANYLIPVDMAYSLEPNETWETQAIPVNHILARLQRKTKNIVLMFNNCARLPPLLNPFVAQPRAPQTRDLNNYSYLVSYSASPGQWARARASKDPEKTTPYGTVLLRYVGTRGLELRELMPLLQSDVAKATNNFQVPHYDDYLQGRNVYLGAKHAPWKRAWFWILAGGVVAGGLALGLGLGLQDRRPVIEPQFP